MGYTPPRVTIDLDFSETQYAGLEVKCATVSLGQLLAVGEQADRLRLGEGLDAAKGLVELFTSKIKSWNLEDEKGEPVPVSLDAVFDLDYQLGSLMILTWQNAMTQAGAELGKGSNSGQQSVPPNFPMEPL